MSTTFRNGFYAGLMVAVALGVYLHLLWQPARQVELHSQHLLEQIEDKDWDAIGAFLAETYADQWQQDRATVLLRLRAVLHYARNLKIEAQEPMIIAGSESGKWRARITLTADPNEVATLIQERVNALAEPFELHWKRTSRKPWDWKLVRVENPALELPDGNF